MTIESICDLARECYLGDAFTDKGQAQQAIADYNWVKEHILYRCSPWRVPGEALVRKSGNCGAKAELLGDTEPGYHLGSPTYTARWDRLPR